MAKDLPPQYFKFRPSLTELVHELKLKNSKNHLQVNRFIPTVEDLFNMDPSEIPGIVDMPWENEEWYVFSPKRGKGIKRKEKSVAWNITGKVKEIVGDKGEELNAKKSILVRKGMETDYAIHEIALNDQNASFVICILKKTVKAKLTAKSSQGKALNTERPMKSKRAKTLACIPESVAGESSGCTESVLNSFNEIGLVHNRSQSNCGVFYGSNLPYLNAGEASNSITCNTEISPTANSVLSVDDYEIQSAQPLSSLAGQKDTMVTSNGISNSEVSTEVPMRSFVGPDENSLGVDDSFDETDGMYLRELYDDNHVTMDDIFNELARQKLLEERNVSGPSAPGRSFSS